MRELISDHTHNSSIVGRREGDLGGFAHGKGTVKIPYGEPVPADLLRRMIAFRVREHEEDGVLWM